MDRGPACTRCGVVLNNVALLNSFPDASRTPADVHRNWRNSACLYASASWQSDAATSPEKAVWRRSDRPVRLQIERPTLGCDQPALGEIISWQRRVTKNVQPRRFFVFELRSCVSPRFAGSKLAAFNASATSACRLGTQFGSGVKASLSPDSSTASGRYTLWPSSKYASTAANAPRLHQADEHLGQVRA